MSINRLNEFWPAKSEPVTNFTRGSKEWSNDVSAAYYEGVANERRLQCKKLRAFRDRLRMRRMVALNAAFERGSARGFMCGVGLAGILFVWWKLKG